MCNRTFPFSYGWFSILDRWLLARGETNDRRDRYSIERAYLVDLIYESSEFLGFHGVMYPLSVSESCTLKPTSRDAHIFPSSRNRISRGCSTFESTVDRSRSGTDRSSPNSASVRRPDLQSEERKEVKEKWNECLGAFI